MTKGRPVPPQQPTTREEKLTLAAQYMWDHWANLAASAYAGSQAKGRGLIYLDFTGRLVGDGTSIGVTYFSQDDILAIFGRWPEEYSRQLVERYDPDREVVFLIHFRGGGESVQAIRGAMAPRVAYEVAKQLHRTTLSA